MSLADSSFASITAIHRVLSLFSHANFNAMVKGTDRSMPIRPNRLPQKINERKTTNVGCVSEARTLADPQDKMPSGVATFFTYFFLLTMRGNRLKIYHNLSIIGI